MGPSSPLASSFSYDKLPRRTSKKLQKKHHGDEQSRLDIPQRLREDDDEDDADSEQAPSQGPPMFMNMNQSIFGLIAAAGTRVDFTERFDGSSSEDESGQNSKGDQSPQDLSQTTILQRPQKEKEKEKKEKKESHHKRRVSGRLLKSLPNLPRFKSKSKREKSKLSSEATEKPAEDADNESEHEPESDPTEPPEIRLTREDSRLAPVMSRMLEARAEIADRPSFDMGRGSTEVSRPSEGAEATPLAKRLMQIFEFNEPEEVIQGQYNCGRHSVPGFTKAAYRVPMLVITKRSPTRLHVHHGQAHLLLCISSKEGSKVPFPVAMIEGTANKK
jgi:sterol 3beta-glucosyltransferase